MPSEINFDGYYSVLPVPRGWVDLNLLLKKYDRAVKNLYGSKAAISFNKMLQKEFTAEAIDFGRLDETDQEEILLRLLRSSEDRSRWLDLLMRSRAGWPGLDMLQNYGKSIIGDNRAAIERMYSRKEFQRKFSSALSVPLIARHSLGNYGKIETWFSESRSYRLLMSAKR